MANLEEPINFTSLGMLILDEVHLPYGEVIENVIGGSGSFGKCSNLGVCHPTYGKDDNKYSQSRSPPLVP